MTINQRRKRARRQYKRGAHVIILDMGDGTVQRGHRQQGRWHWTTHLSG